MRLVDCRAISGIESALSIVEAFSSLQPGEKLEALVSDYNAGMRMWLLEAGVRHKPVRDDDGNWRFVAERGVSPALGTTPGLHHIVANAEGTIWACQRGSMAARFEFGSKTAPKANAVMESGSHMAHDSAGKRVVIADPRASELVVLGSDDLSVKHRLKCPGNPQLPLITPEGIVCCAGSSTGTLTIARPHAGGYDVRVVEVGPMPHDPAISGDGKHLFVPCMGSHDLVKVRLNDGAIVGRVQVGDGPSHVESDPKHNRVYVANSWDGTLTAVSDDGQVIASAYSGAWAHAITLTMDGKNILVANFLDDTITVFDAATVKQVAQLETEPYPHGLDVSPDGRRVVVTGFSSEYVLVYDTATWGAIGRVKIGRGGSHTAFVQDGKIGIVTCEVDDHLACIDLTTGQDAGRLKL
jgi:Uncharacterized conserved protein